MDTANKLRRLTVGEALRELEGLKLGLSAISYTQVFGRLTRWRVLFFEVDFSKATGKEEVDMFEREYRGMRELLQWRVDELQRPAAQVVAALKEKRAGRELMDDDWRQAREQLVAISAKTPYDFSDTEGYQKDLELVVAKEYARLRYGEESVQYQEYQKSQQQLDELWQKLGPQKEVQLAAMQNSGAMITN